MTHSSNMATVTDIRRSSRYPKDFVHYWLRVDGEHIGNLAFLTEMTERQLNNVAYDYAKKEGISASGVRIVKASNHFNYK